MPVPRWLVAVVLLAAGVCLSAVPGYAVVVPGDFATIQGAIDSSTSTLIEVGEGEYDEAVRVNRTVSIAAKTGLTFYALRAYPAIRSFVVTSGRPTFTGIHVRGPVTQTGGLDVTFESCRLDSGFVIPFASAGTFKMRGCLVFGPTRVSGSSVEIIGCTFVGGGLTASAEGDLRVRGNLVTGPADVGMTLASGGADGEVSENRITGATEGLVFYPASPNPTFVANEVYDCSSNAFRVAGENPGNVAFERNRVRRCGGNGFDIGGRVTILTLSRNVVDSVGGAAIQLRAPGFSPCLTRVTDNVLSHARDRGIDVPSGYFPATISGNRVLACAGDGIRCFAQGVVDHNVVGRCGAGGVVVGNTSHVTVRSNTLYRNAGSGIVTTLVSADSISHNIGYLNERYGVEVVSGATPVLGCNDWNGNWLGATAGVAPAANDLQLVPLFCDWAHDVVTLSAVSALLTPPGGCSRIGALGQGCSYPATAHAEGAVGSPALSLSVSPQPNAGRVRFAWAPQPIGATLDVFDAGGARRWSRHVPAGESRLEWSGVDEAGHPLSAGVYFARLSVGGREATSAAVIVR